MTPPTNGQWLPGTIHHVADNAIGPQVDPPLPVAGGGTVPTVNQQQQGCPPGFRDLGGGMCQFCPPPGMGIDCQPISVIQAWRLYALQQRGGGISAGQGGTIAPSPSGPPLPAGTPAPISGPVAPGALPSSGAGAAGQTGPAGTPAGTFFPAPGGGIYTTPGGLSGTGSQPQPRGYQGCYGPFPGPTPPLVSPPAGYRAVQDAAGNWWYCPPGVLPPPPSSAAAPPPPPPGTAQCPQTYTIIQGPPCPQYMAVLGTPASWAATGFGLWPGWSALQSITDTPDNVTAAVNALQTRCVAASMSAPTKPQ